MKIYCELCACVSAFSIDFMRKDTDFPEQGIWGDIVCSCGFVIATLHDVEEEGIYEITKTGDLE